MNQNKLQNQRLIEEVIERSLKDTKKLWVKMAETLFEVADTKNFNETLQILSETLVEYNQQATQKCVKKALFSATSKLRLITNQRRFLEIRRFVDYSAITIKPQIIVKKEREKKYDDFILNQRREKRSKFFTKQIESKLKQAKATQTEQKQTLCLFMENQQNIDLDELGSLTKYKKPIGQLQQLLQSNQKQFQTNRKVCLPMQWIIQNNLDALTVIRIDYQLRYQLGYQCRHSISAFELFRVVHGNKLLHQVTLKGIQVEQFQKFINLLNLLTHNEPIEQQEVDEIRWMKRFNPSKSLKLSISARVRYDINNKDKESTLSRLSNLAFFQSLFCKLSDINAYIILGSLQQNNQWDIIMQKLWDCLRKISEIRIIIWGNQYQQIKASKAKTVRAVLFGGLAFFTEIAQLSFKQLAFCPQIGINDWLAMEQSLSTLFKNNSITHLKLYYCRNFPVFPVINTLQSIEFENVAFRKSIGFMREVTRTNPSLRCIKCVGMEQEWRISKQLFKELQMLIIVYCNGIYFDDIFSEQPSNIKHLQIYNSRIGRFDYLAVIFPKLTNLTSLSLSNINFEHQLLCTIPSPHLEELHIWDNSALIDFDLRMIDQKWPKLASITLRECSKLTKNVWSICDFRELMQLQVDRGMWRKGDKALQELKKRGIQVDVGL